MTTTDPKHPHERPVSGLMATAIRLRKIKRRWRMLRHGVRVLVVLLLLAAGGILFLLFYPVSSAWLDQKIQQRWNETVGLPLKYKRSTIRLARGEIRFEQPALIDPETGERLVDLHRVELNLRLTQLLFGAGPRVIDSLRLEGPAVVRVATLDHKMELLAPWPRVIDMIQERMKKTPRGAKPKVLLRQLVIAPVDLRWIERGEWGSRVRLALEQMSLTVDFDQNKPRQMMLAGNFAEGPGPGREFMVMLRPQGQDIVDLQLRLDSFNTRELQTTPLPLDVGSGQIRLSGRIERDKTGAWCSRGGAQIDGVRLFERAGPMTPVGIVQTRWSGTLDTTAGLLRVESFDLFSGLSELRMRGEAGIQRPWPYDVHIEELRAGGDELKLIADLLVPSAGVIRSGAPRIELTGDFAADAVTTAPTRAEMKAIVFGLDIDVPHLPEPLRGVAGRVEMTSGALTVQNLAATYGGIPLTADGVATGSLPRSVEGLAVSWRTGTPTQPGRTITGDVIGSGTLRLHEPTRGGLRAALRNARVDGGIRFVNASLSDPRLPDRITNMNGLLELRENEARIQKFEARLGPTHLAADGLLRGRESIWTSPTLTMSTHIAGDLPTIAAQSKVFIDQATTRTMTLPTLTGTGSLDARVRDFPPARWRTRPIQVAMKLKDFATTIDLQRAQGPVGVAGDLDGRGTIRFTSERGLPVDFDGQVTIQNGSAQARAIPPLSGVNGKVALSNGTLRFDQFSGEAFGGKATLTGTISGRPQPWIKPRARLAVEISSSLQNVLAQARQRGKNPRPFGFDTFEGDATLKFNVDGPLGEWRAMIHSGRLDIDDFGTSFTVARVNGPLRIKHLAIALEKDQLRIEPATGQFGAIDLSMEGLLKPDGGLVNLKLGGELLEMQRRSPPGLEKFDVGGTASIEHHQKIAPKPGYKPPQNWTGLIEYFSTIRDQEQGLAQLMRDWSWDFDGTIRMADGEMTLWRMPTPLKGITGMVYYNNGRLWSPEPLIVKPVGSRNVRSTLEITWKTSPREATLNYGVTGEHFALDEWLKPWNKRRKSPKPPPPFVPFDPNLKPWFTIRGTFKTDTGEFRGIQVRDVDGIMTLDDWRGRPFMLRWYLSQASVYGGKADVSGSVYGGRFEGSFETRNVELRPLAEALSKRKSPGGLLTGIVTGRMELAKNMRERGPLTGHGRVHITQSRMVSNAILHSLGGLLRLPILEDISFSTVHGPIEIANNRVSSDDMVFDNPILNMKVSGSVGFDKTLDLQISAQILQIASGVPLVGEAVDVLNRLVGKVIRVEVKGTTDDPKITPL